MFKRRQQVVSQAQSDAIDQVHETARSTGGALATIISAFALVFSGYSFYESVLKSPKLEVFAPPRIAYTDPDRPDSPFEVFVIPLTLANDGARSGTVLSIDLDVTNPRTNQTKRFYSAQTGPWGQEPFREFAPISLSGRTAHSQAIQFFPREEANIPRILDFEPGRYKFKVTLNTTQEKSEFEFLKANVKPLEFEMKIGKLDYRNFNGTGTMAMWSPDYKPAATTTAPE